MTTELVEDPVFRYRYRFAREDHLLRIEVWADPGGGALVEHFHPRAEERFVILDGAFTFTVDGEKRSAGRGDRLVVAPGVRHSFENTGQDVGHLRVEAEPAAGLQESLEDAAALARAGMYTRRGLPRGLRGLLATAVFAERYRDVVVVTSPPPALQRLVMPGLARLGRRRERKAQR